MSLDPGLRRLLSALALAALTWSAPAADLTVMTPDRTLTLDTALRSELPRLEIAARDPHSGEERRYAGVPMRDVLVRAGAPLGEKLRGPALALGVLFEAADGYRVLFALAEFDEAFSARTWVLADSRERAPLPDSAGPFQLVSPGDKRGARWIRQIKSIRVITLP